MKAEDQLCKHENPAIDCNVDGCDRVVKYEVLRPTCIGCQKEIDKPAECDMEAFRFGMPMHITCVAIYDNISRAIFMRV